MSSYPSCARCWEGDGDGDRIDAERGHDVHRPHPPFPTCRWRQPCLRESRGKVLSVGRDNRGWPGSVLQPHGTCPITRQSTWRLLIPSHPVNREPASFVTKGCTWRSNVSWAPGYGHICQRTVDDVRPPTSPHSSWAKVSRFRRTRHTTRLSAPTSRPTSVLI
jgi:hypothetical protein